MNGERRVFVLDTNVLLSFGVPALHAFDGAQVVVPLIVVSEIDRKRNDVGLEHNARAVLRELDKLIEADSGEDDPVRVEMNHIEDSKIDPVAIRSLSTNDARILTVAFNLKSEGRNVTLVTEDIMLSLGAKAAKVPSEKFMPSKRTSYSGYPDGYKTVIVEREFINNMYSGSDLILPDNDPAIEGVLPNTFVVFKTEGGASALAFATKNGINFSFRLIRDGAEVFGVKPKSKEQKFAVDLLTNPDVKVVSLGGKAGTGKTFLALMAGLDHILERSGTCEKITVFRPVMAVGGQELGHLPGTQEEKMAPWGQAIFDALESELEASTRTEIAERNLLEILPLTHIRGRSLHRQWVIIDEAQNLDLPSILAVLTRTGKGTKVILNWDESQRDNQHVSRFNGVVEAVNRMYGHHLFGHVTLVKSERSDVAEMAASLLDG